jgi:hypothetical protein
MGTPANRLFPVQYQGPRPHRGWGPNWVLKTQKSTSAGTRISAHNVIVCGWLSSMGEVRVSGVTKEDLRSLLYLLSLGIVGAATVGIFLGVGFMWLADTRPAVSPADSIQASKEDEFPPGEHDTVRGLSPTSSAENVVATSAPEAPVNQAAPNLRSAALERSPTPPAEIAHPKRVGVSRHRHQRTTGYWVASWRPDASAGPNPGGGFYGPPNANVGYINPR